MISHVVVGDKKQMILGDKRLQGSGLHSLSFEKSSGRVGRV